MFKSLGKHTVAIGKPMTVERERERGGHTENCRGGRERGGAYRELQRRGGERGRGGLEVCVLCAGTIINPSLPPTPY